MDYAVTYWPEKGFGHRAYQAIEHLIEHGPQTPPVNGAIIRLLLQHLRG